MSECVYILFKANLYYGEPPIIVAVFANEEDAYAHKEQMFYPEKYFIEEWEIL